MQQLSSNREMSIFHEASTRVRSCRTVRTTDASKVPRVQRKLINRPSFSRRMCSHTKTVQLWILPIPFVFAVFVDPTGVKCGSLRMAGVCSGANSSTSSLLMSSPANTIASMSTSPLSRFSVRYAFSSRNNAGSCWPHDDEARRSKTSSNCWAFFLLSIPSRAISPFASASTGPPSSSFS